MNVDARKSYLDQAREVTLESRQVEYGHPLINFLNIALRWSLWKKVVFTPYDVAMMMTDTKIARQQHTHKEDNLVDGIGYLSCVDRMDEYMLRLGYWKGIRTFIEEDWDLERLLHLQRQLEDDTTSFQAPVVDKEIPF